MSLSTRIAEGLSRRKLSYRTGATKVLCSPAHLMRIAKGAALPDYPTLMRIADAVGGSREAFARDWMAEHARASGGQAMPHDLPATVASAWSMYATTYDVVAREIEVVGTITGDGDFRVERRYRGVRPTRSMLAHRVVQERAIGVEPGPSSSSVVVDKAIEGLNIDMRSETVGAWRVHSLRFEPAWSPDSPPLSYTIHSVIPGAYATTTKEHRARLLQEPDEDPAASHAHRLNDAAERLILSVHSPHDEQWLEPEAWRGPGPRMDSILDRLCVSYEQVVGPRSCTLTIERPLPGHWYSVRWAANLE